MTKFSAQQQSQLAQIGAFLRETREQQGKSLEDIAIRTYIRPQLLSGIELGDPELLPEPIFVQGFIRRYAENLGLKGTELAEQFSVDSIPSTPRPPRPSVPEDSPTTRLTRLSTGEDTAEASAEHSAAGAAMFSAGSASPLEDSLTVARSQSEAEDLGSRPLTDEVPLIVDAAVLDSQPVQSEKRAAEMADFSFSQTDISSVEATEPMPTEPTLTSDFPNLIGESASSDASSMGLDSYIESDIESGSSTNLSASDFPTADLPSVDSSGADSSGVERDFSGKVAEFDRQNMTPASGAAAVTPTSTTPTPTTPTSTTLSEPAAYTAAPVGVEYDRTEGPNLKPFIIGGIVAALLTAAVVALASLFGGDRSPSVADSSSSSAVEQSENELETIGTETLPPIPDEAAAPPASTAPIYVEAEATAEAWVSVIVDGASTPLFEGTLQPGDKVVWEGQEIINVYSGDAGALELAQNGGAAAVMGERGQPEEKIFTLN